MSVTMNIHPGIVALPSAISQVIVGQHEAVAAVLIGLLSGGHVLLEGLPGLGKTLLVKTVCALLNLEFRRIQCTPDLTSRDMMGGYEDLVWTPGPIFTQLLLVDEINRAMPRAQAALLEAMQERAVTIRGTTYPLEQPFLLLATQNPLEMEGTNPLPEAQIDRFALKVYVQPPTRDELFAIVHRATGNPADMTPLLGAAELLMIQQDIRALPLVPSIQDYIVRLAMATHPDDLSAPPMVQRYVLSGVSPRGAQSLAMGARAHAYLHGRDEVSADDVQAVTIISLQHRLTLMYEALAAGIRPASIIEEILHELPVEEL